MKLTDAVLDMKSISVHSIKWCWSFGINLGISFLNRFTPFSSWRRSPNSKNIHMTLVGICLGLTLGVSFVPIFDTFWCDNSGSMIQYGVRLGNTFPYPSTTSSTLSKSNYKVTEVQSESESESNVTDSKFWRPRFTSTELEIRKKLIAGILVPSSANVNVSNQIELVATLNRTLHRHVNKLIFFVSNWEHALRLSNGGIKSANVIVLDENEPDFGLNAIKYFRDVFINDYDFYFLGRYNYYVNGKLLSDFVQKISVSEWVFWGQVADDSPTCQLDTGIILSRSILSTLYSRTENSRTSTNPLAKIKEPDGWIGLIAGLNLTCNATVQNQKYKSSNSSNASEWETSISIGPVLDVSNVLEIHQFICQRQKVAIAAEIAKIQSKIQKLHTYQHVNLGPLSWPIGLPPSSKPKMRSDVIKWIYFTNDSIFHSTEYSTNISLKSSGIDQLDISNILNSSIHFLQKQFTFTAHHPNNRNEFTFLYGYRRFDATRGMEYILDFKHASGAVSRVEGLRPLLGNIEIVPMSFVTESRRITIIITITKSNVNSTRRFLNQWFNNGTTAESKLNAVVLLVFVTFTSSLPVFDDSEYLRKDEIERTKLLISEFNLSKPKDSTMSKIGYVVFPMSNSSIPVNVAAFDHLTKRNLLKPHSLVLLLVETNVDINDEFLNRVRMNTIMNEQIYSPIPFAEFIPELMDLYHFFKPNSKHRFCKPNLEIHKSRGYFQLDEFRFLSFYMVDYLNARQTIKSYDNWNGLVDIFLHGTTNLHILRAPEPNLKLRFTYSAFNLTVCAHNFEMCSKRWWANKGQLAQLILKTKL